jgi:hypothetical protein
VRNLWFDLYRSGCQAAQWKAGILLSLQWCPLSPSVYSTLGRCQSKAVRGDLLEQQVLSEVEAFLRNPEPVLQQLQARLESDSQDADQIRRQVMQLEGLLTQKATERSRMVGLYRRGRLAER